MPIIESSNYFPTFLLRNKHLNTLYPFLFRKFKNLPYKRVRIDTPDGDFLDLDFSQVDSKIIIIILHGMEGSTSSVYIKGITKISNLAKFDTLGINLRGCSETPNRLFNLYHSGATQDLHTVIEYLLKEHFYKKIMLVGFSLGGNITLKYIGEQGKNIFPEIKAAVTVSVPCNLHSAAEYMSKPSNKLYLSRFIRSLKKKILLKAQMFPNKLLNKEAVKNAKNFYDIDSLYTAPANGFKSAIDYWTKCSCEHFLSTISIPTLLINAKDDPFLPAACYPFKTAKKSNYFYFEAPKYGGHVGFTKKMNFKNPLWHEERIIDFLKKK